MSYIQKSLGFTITLAILVGCGGSDSNQSQSVNSAGDALVQTKGQGFEISAGNSKISLGKDGINIGSGDNKVQIHSGGVSVQGQGASVNIDQNGVQIQGEGANVNINDQNVSVTGVHGNIVINKERVFIKDSQGRQIEVNQPIQAFNQAVRNWNQGNVTIRTPDGQAINLHNTMKSMEQLWTQVGGMSGHLSGNQLEIHGKNGLRMESVNRTFQDIQKMLSKMQSNEFIRIRSVNEHLMEAQQRLNQERKRVEGIGKVNGEFQEAMNEASNAMNEANKAIEDANSQTEEAMKEAQDAIGGAMKMLDAFGDN